MRLRTWELSVICTTEITDTVWERQDNNTTTTLKKQNKTQIRQRHESGVHRRIAAKISKMWTHIQNNKEGAQQSCTGRYWQRVTGIEGRDVRATVMPLQSCGYTVMLTSLRESFMGGGEGGERNGEEQEGERTDKSQHQENITAIVFLFSFW